MLRNWAAVSSWTQGGITWDRFLDLPEWQREELEEWVREQQESMKK